MPDSLEGPVTVRVRMYQVGFGDCLLLSFEYDHEVEPGRRDRQVLMDFGSMSLARGARTLGPTAKRILEHCGGNLDAVIVSHRHRDHLSGFGAEGVGTLLPTPMLVVRSWTEDPDLPANAEAPLGGGPGADSVAFQATLGTAHAFASKLADAIKDAPRSELGSELQHIAEDQLPNKEAVEQLAAWSEGGRGEYLHHGKETRLTDLIPGVGVRVLGPPTVEQHEEVRTQRQRDPDEFWMLYSSVVDQARPFELLQGLVAAGIDDVPDEQEEEAPPSVSARSRKAPPGPIGPIRWLTQRLGRQQLNSLLRIVRILDDALNNTSLILLFEATGPAGTTRMLFPGDAQIENWEYVLKYAPDRESHLGALDLVDLYKVGHHGSRNATPHSLFDRWEPGGEANRPLTALMSTKPNVHGKHAATAVPRRTLVEALKRRTDLHSTSSLRKATAWYEAVADLTRGTSFTVTEGPPEDG